jgi:hypothetical protein
LRETKLSSISFGNHDEAFSKLRDTIIGSPHDSEAGPIVGFGTSIDVGYQAEQKVEALTLVRVR